ncbi:dienelactone hydrolase family protein [Nonomuraea sp. NPDC050383]|uniref:dienelactone hydrolase family protein n=1 Tax=Nonomuraea sp. NPDC050383 TaxID=3364362 RepID=UPI0037A41D6E
MTTRTVEYPADGLTMIGHLALPAGVDRRPAVLVGPEGPGLSDVERRRADALAELGYVALAFDLHGGRLLTDPEEMLARCMPLLADPDGVIRPVQYRSPRQVSGVRSGGRATRWPPDGTKDDVCAV